jgi:putative ABC transport system ATP-binding protein
MTLVDIRKLDKSYTAGGETTHVLRGMDLELKRGEMVMVMGPSGSGKTTLLNLLGGIDGADSGLLLVDGLKLTELQKKELNRFRRERVGFIFQFYNLIPTLTAIENVELGLENLVKSRKEMRERARKYLDMVGLSDKANNYPQELSGGQQQRVAIARALAKEPSLILADEPTGNLDEEREQSIMEIMKDLQHKLKITFLIVSHNTRLKRYMDRTLILRHGKLQEAS